MNPYFNNEKPAIKIFKTVQPESIFLLMRKSVCVMMVAQPFALDMAIITAKSSQLEN